MSGLREIKNQWVGPMRCDPAGYPYPTTLIGTGLIWDNETREKCPACNDGPIKPQQYCLYCDRWGLDSEWFAAYLGIEHGGKSLVNAVPHVEDGEVLEEFLEEVA